jgi:hypothetical protein
LEPFPTPEESSILFGSGKTLLALKSNSLKYHLRALHFLTAESAQRILDYDLVDSHQNLLKYQDGQIPIHLLLISSLFKVKSDLPSSFLSDLACPMAQLDPNVRAQCCRTIADYILDSATFENALKYLCTHIIK